MHDCVKFKNCVLVPPARTSQIFIKFWRGPWLFHFQLTLKQQVIIVKNPPLTGLDEVNKWAVFPGGFILGEKLCWHRDSSPRLYDPSTEILTLDKNQIRRNLQITGINLVPPVSFVAHVAHVANMLPMLPMLPMWRLSRLFINFTNAEVWWFKSWQWERDIEPSLVFSA